MTSENPIGRKIVKGQNRSRGSALPRRYNRVPAQTVTYPEFGEEIIEPSTRRRFLQGIPITRQSVSHITEISDYEQGTQRSDLERQLHQEDIDQNRRPATNNGEAWEIPFLIDRLDPLYRFSRNGAWHPTIIADRDGYFPEGFINRVEQIPDRVERVDRICRYVRENEISRTRVVPGEEGIIFDDPDQVYVDVRYDEYYGQLAQLCQSDIERPPCIRFKELVEKYLDEGFVLELVAEGRTSGGGGTYAGPLLKNVVTGSITNFALQTPVAIDDCAIEDLYSSITTDIETATAEGVFQIHVDPLDERTLRLPAGTSLTDWPGRDYTNFSEFWDTALAHERDLQARNRTTYYGDIDKKDKGGFPRYAGLSIPTYQASSFVNLFNSLDAERRIYPHIVGHMGDPDEYDTNSYRMEWQFYHAEDGWKEISASFLLKQTSLTKHFRHLQRLTEDEPDIFDVIPDQTAAAQQMGLADDFGLGPDLGLVAIPECPPFMDRIRAMLAEEASGNLLQDLADNQFRSEYGLFLGMINGDLEYTEPLFYKVTRDRVVPEGSRFGDVGHLMVRSGVPILGAQPIFHANKAENSYFTFEDRFVDYGDIYQYNIDTYAVVMRTNYEASQISRTQVSCLRDVQPQRIEAKLGEGVIYSLVAFEPYFDVVKIPYVHRNYTDLQGEPPEMSKSRLGVALPPVLILDNPPIAPGVDIVPYHGVADKMLFMFDFQTDKIVDEYIHLSDNEKRLFEAIHSRQKKTICDLCENSVEFASEGEDIGKIQVFRTTTVPEMISEQNPSQLYRDAFGSQPYREIDATMGSAFVDDIEPNTKYFYMFRAVDKAKYLGGLVSNPSHIYRVEMVEEDGLIFPIIELYTPKMKKRGVKYRKVAKHLEIKPALLMTEPNWSADDDNNISWKIGARDDSIFSMRGDTNGRQFKIRLTSIDTGRKMEINVRFNKETNRVEAIDDRDIGE
jgi:hypothetical protein